MLNTPKLRATIELYRRRDALGPNRGRDALLGWAGFLGLLAVLWGVFS